MLSLFKNKDSINEIVHQRNLNCIIHHKKKKKKNRQHTPETLLQSERALSRR